MTTILKQINEVHHKNDDLPNLKVKSCRLKLAIKRDETNIFLNNIKISNLHIAREESLKDPCAAIFIPVEEHPVIMMLRLENNIYQCEIDELKEELTLNEARITLLYA